MSIRSTLVWVGLLCTSCTPSLQKHLAVCEASYKNEDVKNAILACRKALASEPRSGEALYWLGLAYWRDGKGAESYEALRHAATVQPNDPRIRHAFGDISLEALRAARVPVPAIYQQFIETADWFLAQNPASADGLRFKAWVLLLDKKPSEAVPLFRRAYEQDRTNRNVALGLSQALFESNQFVSGEQVATALIASDRAFADPYDLLYRRYLSANRPQDAERILTAKTATIPTPAVLLQLATHYHLTRNVQQRDAILQRVLLLDKFSDRMMQLGDFAMRIGDSTAAIQHYEAGLKMDAGNAAAYNQKIVNVLVTSQRVDEAIARLGRVLEDTPENADARATRAVLLLNKGRLDEAAVDFDRVLKQRLNDHIIRFNHGRLLAAKRNWQAARSEFQTAISIQPRFLPARYLLCEINLLLKRTQEAVASTRELLELDPQNPKAQFLHATALGDSGQHDAALERLTRLVTRFPKSPELRLQVALTQLARGRYAEAEKIFRTLDTNAAPADVRGVMGLSETLYLQNHTDEALRLLEQRLKDRPNPQIARVYANLASRAGKHDLAIRQWERLLIDNPASIEIQTALAVAHRQNRNWNSATVVLERAMQAQPKNAALLHQLAYTYQSSGNVGKALELYRRAQAEAPGDTDVMNNLANLLLNGSDRDLDEALSLAEKAVRSAPQRAEYADTLGLAYIKKKRTDSALQIFRSLVSRHPDRATFRHHLGLALLTKGDKQGARAELQSALSKKVDKDEEVSIREALAQL